MLVYACWKGNYKARVTDTKLTRTQYVFICMWKVYTVKNQLHISHCKKKYKKKYCTYTHTNVTFLKCEYMKHMSDLQNFPKCCPTKHSCLYKGYCWSGKGLWVSGIHCRMNKLHNYCYLLFATFCCCCCFVIIDSYMLCCDVESSSLYICWLSPFLMIVCQVSQPTV